MFHPALVTFRGDNAFAFHEAVAMFRGDNVFAFHEAVAMFHGRISISNSRICDGAV
jgi:hypothetical protein